MKKKFLLIICLIFSALSNAEDVQKTVILKSSKSWDNKEYLSYPTEKPEITVLNVTIMPNTTLKWHTHPCISTVYMVDGDIFLRTQDNSVLRKFHKGEVFNDLVGTIHQGQSGKDGAKMLVFFACSPEKKLTIPALL